MQAVRAEGMQQMDYRYDGQNASPQPVLNRQEPFWTRLDETGFSVFRRRIGSKEEFDAFGHSPYVIDFEPKEGVSPDIEICGVSRNGFSVWRLSSRSGFRGTTRTDMPGDIILVQMPMQGCLQVQDAACEQASGPGFGVIAPFNEIRDISVSAHYRSINCTFRTEALMQQMRVLDEADTISISDFETATDLATPALRSLRSNISLTCELLMKARGIGTLSDALIETYLLNQLIGSWPRHPPRLNVMRPPSSRHVQRSLDFIEANLARSISVAEIAHAAGIGVRALQSSFRKDLGRTPIQYIIDRRLEQVHIDLRQGGSASISAVASRWGFIHMSDFSRRYRQHFGCTPSETQIRANHPG